ncbi:hypothetical protein GCM10010232_17900 [Streptomyces amakusaensis]
MRDARRISTREVSHGVQRHVLAQTTWLGSTVMAHSGAGPLVFACLTAGFHQADHGLGAQGPERTGPRRSRVHGFPGAEERDTEARDTEERDTEEPDTGARDFMSG